jgi:hypothetical protein
MIIDLSLTDVFGSAASQTATTITIAKADLPGLTATAANNGQQIFVAILLRLMLLDRISDLSSPGGHPLTYPVDQNPIRFQLWRVVPVESWKEIIFTLELWS